MASRYLNNITINDAYTLPATDGTNGQGIVTDGAGNLSFQDLASTTSTSALSIVLTVKNVSGGSLSPGTLVRVAPTATPPSGNVLEVDVADNSASSTMPAIGIITDTIADQAEGDCVAFGRAAGFSTSGYTEGDPIWVGTNGGFTGTKPTGTALIQRVGQIIKVHATNGSIEVFGAGRSNDVPNIPQDQLWLGNSNGVATPTDHTVENISNVTVTSKQDGQALVWDAANNYWKNGNVASGGGGSGSTLSIERNVFTATANQTAFVISSTIGSSSNTQVYIDGVYQSKDNYTTSGSTVTFSTGVPAGAIVEVIHFISVYSKIYTDTFTGDGSIVDFTASKDVTDENITQVYIDGVYQSKDNYSTSGTTITFSTAPPNGSAVEVVHFEEISYSAIASNQFTGTGSQTDFTLTQEVDEDKSFVFIQGVYQEKSTYSITGTTLTFTTAPQSGYTVEVITIGAVSVVSDALYVDTFTGNGSTVDYTLSSTPANINAIDVYLNGIYQNKSNFSISGTTLTFSTAPTNGTAIEVKSTGAYIVSAGVNSVNGQSGDVTISVGTDWQSSVKTADFTAVAGEGYFVNTTSAAITVTLPSSPSTGDEVTIVDYAGTANTHNITITSSDDINGATDDVIINYERGGVSLVYVDSTQGWISYNATNETAKALAPDVYTSGVDAYNDGNTTDGFYDIQLPGWDAPKSIYCDMTNDGGGWMLWGQRLSSSNTIDIRYSGTLSGYSADASKGYLNQMTNLTNSGFIDMWSYFDGTKSIRWYNNISGSTTTTPGSFTTKVLIAGENGTSINNANFWNWQGVGTNCSTVSSSNRYDFDKDYTDSGWYNSHNSGGNTCSGFSHNSSSDFNLISNFKANTDDGGDPTPKIQLFGNGASGYYNHGNTYDNDFLGLDLVSSFSDVSISSHSTNSNQIWVK